MAGGSAKRYVQAIVEIAREQGSFDAWQRDLGMLRSAVGSASSQALLGNPSISEAAKIDALDTLLAGAQPEARNLAQMLIRRKRTGIADELADLFDEAVLSERGIILVDVTTAEVLDEAGQILVREHLGKLLNKDVELRLHVDPSIIGGFVARAGDQVIDGSVANQLRRLRSRLLAA